MSIGPAPMIRVHLMSVRFGIAALFLLHQRGESIEEIPDVVRPGARFRMALEAERRPVGARETLEAAVEQRYVRRAERRGQARRVDRETVVLARDHDLAGVEILHRMVRPVMAELHL